MNNNILPSESEILHDINVGVVRESS